MIIDKETCIGCELCTHYCPVGAIKMMEWEGEPKAEIDPDECVECDACRLRARVCPVDAIHMPELEWPRVIRAYFSNPHVQHPSTGEQGRGTGEMKTNDVTGRYPRGIAGVVLEMGRPGIGTSIRDLQTATMILAKMGVEFEPDNPVAAIMADMTTGKIKDDVLNEKVLSAMIEFKIENERLRDAFEAIKAVSKAIDTVFSLDLVSRVSPDGTIPTAPVAEAAGFCPRPNAKINVGLGKPRVKED